MLLDFKRRILKADATEEFDQLDAVASTATRAYPGPAPILVVEPEAVPPAIAKRAGAMPV